MSRSAPWLAATLVALLAAGLPAHATDNADVRTLTVTGNGEVHAAPDRAAVTLGVEARGPTLEAARGAAGRVVAALLKLARDLGVADVELRSTRIAVQPDYVWSDPKKTRTLVGYIVRRHLQVELHNLDRLGELIEQGIGAGANVVGEPQLDSSRRAELGREALARAVAAARANALVLARGLDATVGAARTASTSESGAGPMPRAMRYASAVADKAPETYETGELAFSASVTATFDLVPGAAPR